jgi:iron complex transport system substrate-binding protein
MNHLPQRVVSLQPSVTSTIEHLGLLDRVVACTKYCVDVCPSLKGSDKLIVADSWSSKSAHILEAKPDLVIASVPYQLESVAEILKAGITFLGLAPHSLEDVFADIMSIANILGAPERGRRLIEEMQSEFRHVAAQAARVEVKEGEIAPRVYCEEWGKPLIHSQGWVAEMTRIAGGEFIGTAGAHTDAETVREANPDVIIAAWCGAGDRVPLEKIVEERGWSSTEAAKNGRVFCINDEYLNTPGPTLISGLYALGAAIHPEIFPKSAGLRRIASSDSPAMAAKP